MDTRRNGLAAGHEASAAGHDGPGSVLAAGHGGLATSHDGSPARANLAFADVKAGDVKDNDINDNSFARTAQGKSAADSSSLSVPFRRGCRYHLIHGCWSPSLPRLRLFL